MAEERTERRLVAILAADVVGYSRLMGEDEEGTLGALNSHIAELIEPLITEHNGRMVKTTGDGLLVEYSSVVDAVHCAVAFQKGMTERNADVPENQQIEFRIGINVGDVIIQNGDVFGDGVNVAARLEGLADAGGICISRAARDQIRDKLDYGLEDLGEIEVKNISRPVRAFRVHLEKKGFGPGDTKHSDAQKPRKWIVIALLCVLVIVVCGVIWFQYLRDPLNPDRENKNTASAVAQLRPALIVLPFNNLSNDPKQDYFSDGFTEDITTGLARIRGLLVVARNTAFTFKGKAADARALGRDLGVRYVLEGSARQQGGRLRITAQLIETASGTHVWAERFDRPMKDIFIVQDALVDRIVGSVAARLRRHEGQRALSASRETLAAYDLTLRARLLFRKNTIEAMNEARKLLYRANKIDAGYSPAFSVLAQVEQFFFTSRVSEEYARPATAKRVIDAAARAVSLSPEDALAHAVHGMSLRMKGDYEGAAREARNAQRLGPNDPQVLASVAVILLSVGDYKISVETMRLAWLLDPHLSPVFTGAVLSQGLFALGEYKGSKEVALDCLAKTPGDVRCHESLVRALGELGPPEEAKRAANELLRLSPNYSISEYIRRASKNRRDKAAIARWADGLRKAGIPE